MIASRCLNLPWQKFEVGMVAQELSLVGNCLTELPDGVTRLTKLKRLGLAGEAQSAT